MRENLIPQPTSIETAVVVENYPYGWQKRTKARYWIETTKNGQRIVFQTLNPKTQCWNKPKKSTYSEICILYLNTENNHVENDCFSIAYTNMESLTNFLSRNKAALNKYQWTQVKLAKAIYKAREHLTFTIHTNPSEIEQKQIEANEKKAKEFIPQAINHYLQKDKDKSTEEISDEISAETIANKLKDSTD